MTPHSRRSKKGKASLFNNHLGADFFKNLEHSKNGGYPISS